MAQRTFALWGSELSEIQYSRDGSMWSLLPGTAGYEESGGEADTRTVPVYEGIGSLAGFPAPQSIAVTVNAYMPYHPGWIDMYNLQERAEPAWFRALTRPTEFLFTPKGEIALAASGVVTYPAGFEAIDFSNPNNSIGGLVWLFEVKHAATLTVDGAITESDDEVTASAAHSAVINDFVIMGGTEVAQVTSVAGMDLTLKRGTLDDKIHGTYAIAHANGESLFAVNGAKIEASRIEIASASALTLRDVPAAVNANGYAMALVLPRLVRGPTRCKITVTDRISLANQANLVSALNLQPINRLTRMLPHTVVTPGNLEDATVNLWES